jgi:hypothetical protein
MKPRENSFDGLIAEGYDTERLAGMRLHERWDNWNREPFTSECRPDRACNYGSARRRKRNGVSIREDVSFSVGDPVAQSIRR